ncbi:carboxypeptidase regulatory-like domain-containing protein [Gemmatimonadota bacterium]
MRLVWTVLFSGVLLVGAHEAHGQHIRGQSIRGRVMVAGDTLGVTGADVFLTDSMGVSLSHVTAGDDGTFQLPVPEPGSFRIRAGRIGYATIRAPVEVGENEVVEVELRMAAEAIPLEPIVVTARREIRQGTLDEFYDRMARMKQKGKGQFLTPEAIEAWGSVDLPILLQTLPGIWAEPAGASGYSLRMRSMGGWCSPEFYLDGLPMQSFHKIPVMDLEGVELYRGPFEPVDGYWPDRCGTIFLWRKNDFGSPFTWRRAFFAVGFGATIAGLGQLIF